MNNDTARDVFISHASEDKETIVRSLAKALEKAGFSVWLDEAAIRWGDSFTEQINDGLARSEYVIVVLSERFLAKPWPERELNATLGREASTGKVRVLPLWADARVSLEDIFERYPLLQDKLFAIWGGDPERIVSAFASRKETRQGHYTSPSKESKSSAFDGHSAGASSGCVPAGAPASASSVKRRIAECWKFIPKKPLIALLVIASLSCVALISTALITRLVAAYVVAMENVVAVAAGTAGLFLLIFMLLIKAYKEVLATLVVAFFFVIPAKRIIIRYDAIFIPRNTQWPEAAEAEFLVALLLFYSVPLVVGYLLVSIRYIRMVATSALRVPPTSARSVSRVSTGPS